MQGRANSKPCLLLFQFRKTRKRMWSVDWSEYMSHGREWLFRMATVSHLWTTLDASSAVLKRNRFTNHLETIADVTSSLICWFLRFRRHMFFVVGVAVFKDDLLMFLSSPPPVDWIAVCVFHIDLLFVCFCLLNVRPSLLTKAFDLVKPATATHCDVCPMSIPAELTTSYLSYSTNAVPQHTSHLRPIDVRIRAHRYVFLSFAFEKAFLYLYLYRVSFLVKL